MKKSTKAMHRKERDTGNIRISEVWKIAVFTEITIHTTVKQFCVQITNTLFTNHFCEINCRNFMSLVHSAENHENYDSLNCSDTMHT